LKAPAQDAGERRLVQAAQEDPRRFAAVLQVAFGNWWFPSTHVRT